METTFYEKNNLFRRGSVLVFVFLFLGCCSLLQVLAGSLGFLVGCSASTVIDEEVDEEVWTASLIVSRDRQ